MDDLDPVRCERGLVAVQACLLVGCFVQSPLLNPPEASFVAVGASHVTSAVRRCPPSSAHTCSVKLAAVNSVTAAICTAGAALLARLVLKWQVDAATGARSGPGFLLPLRDVLSFGVFLASFPARSVGWRGRRFTVQADGLMTGR